MVALGYGVATNSKISELSSSVNLTGSIFYNEKRAKLAFSIVTLMPFYINSKANDAF